MEMLEFMGVVAWLVMCLIWKARVERRNGSATSSKGSNTLFNFLMARI